MKVINPVETPLMYSFDQNGNRSAGNTSIGAAGPRLRPATLMYDSRADQTRRVEPINQRATLVYDAAGLLLEVRVVDATFVRMTPVYANSLPIRHVTVNQCVECPLEVRLTRTELQVLRLLPKFPRYADLAGYLCMSTRTLHRHMESLFRKSGVHQRHLLIEWARKRGLIDND